MHDINIFHSLYIFSGGIGWDDLDKQELKPRERIQETGNSNQERDDWDAQSQDKGDVSLTAAAASLEGKE